MKITANTLIIALNINPLTNKYIEGMQVKNYSNPLLHTRTLET